MKILVAMMSHETNTFSPVPTPIARFGGVNGPAYGADARRVGHGRSSSMAGMYRVAEATGAEIVTPIAAGAPPSGPVFDDAYEHMSDVICDAAQGCDALLLALHGAMVTETHEDGEGVLLARLRQLYPDIPIGVALDMHANLYPAMVENCTVITGYQTYPHIDTYETGARAARVLLRALAGEITPTMTWGNCPMIPHVMRQGTDDFPNNALQLRVAEMEESEAVAVSLFTGFPHADIRNAGLSVVVVTDNDPGKAEALKNELLDSAWRERHQFVYKLRPLEDSIDEAISIAEGDDADGPVILLDHYDNTASGGTMDTTEVLREIIDRGLTDVAAFAIHDPEVVNQLAKMGVGNEATISLGAKFHMSALSEQSKPLTVTGTVRLISDGRFQVSGPMGTGGTMNMGTSVVFRTGEVDIIIISRHVEPFDLGCFTSLGIDPLKQKYLMLKSRIHYRAGFKPIAKAIVECAGRGVCTSDYSQLDFKNVRRPIFPLDNLNTDDFREGFPDD